MLKRIAIFSVFLLAVCGWAGPAAAQPAAQYDVYKLGQDGNAVPDVNKVNPADPNDQSCWTATAATLLAGAGWGMAGNTSQQNADAIYGQLTNRFGLQWPGCEELAINWWLINYGHNPNALDSNYYNPVGRYTDVTHVNRSLGPADYDFLLDEANRCQYVAVSFMKPGSYVGHVMTLVGGNYSLQHQPPGGPQVSVWHDSDDGVNGDATHNNHWVFGSWRLDYWGIPDQNTWWFAENYTTLCPGLHKPQYAVENYDVAWYKDMDADGNWYPTKRIAGAKKLDGYGQPQWLDSNTFHVNNEFWPEYHKEVYLLIDYLDYSARAVDPNDFFLTTSTNPIGYPVTSALVSDGNGQLLLTWLLPDQPMWEDIHFPSSDYFTLDWPVKDWDVATICIPEPATAALLVLGGLAALRRHRRR